MPSTVRHARCRPLPALCLLAGFLLLTLAGCGGGGTGGTCSGASCPVTSYTITVASSNPASGVAISYGNAATALLATGTTTFSVTESAGTTMIFGAPATASNNNFSSWSGCSSVSGANCTVTVSGNVTITANYVTPVAPTVTVTPSPATITTAQSLSVAVAVAASQGGATPTGSIVLTSGSYTSAATALSNGSATISVPAGSLAAGTDSLKATYTPDTASSTAYATSSGTGSVTVNALIAPTVTVTPSPTSITTAQALSVAVAVAASPGGATPTGSIVLTSGTYTSAATTLSSGSATISVPAGSLPTGTDSLKATYTPDTASSTAYTTSSGTGSVTVTLPPPTITLGLSQSSILTTQSLTVTVTTSGTPTPTGSIVLTSGTYTSATTTLSAGVALITVPAGSLAAGTNTLTATYTPDSASSSTYGKGTQTATVTVSYAITVASSNPASGVSITVSPKDVNGNGSGSTPISLAYGPNTTVTLTAPATANGNTFTSWTGCSSASGATCTLNVSAAATVTANYASVSVTPTGNVTIGQSQQFTATVTGLSPTTVTWSVAVASGTGSAGTISSSGLYQTPYPAPTTVTITATSTANTSIKGTATVTLAAPATTAGPALSIDANPSHGTGPISSLIYGVNAYLLDAPSAQNANISVARWGGDDTSRYNYQTNIVNSANDYYFENFTGSNSMLPNGNNGNGTNFNDFMTSANTLGISTIATAPVNGWVSNSTVNACSFTKSAYPNQQSYDPSGNCGNGVQNGTTLVGNNTIAAITSISEPPPAAPGAGNNTASWGMSTWTGGWVNCLLTKGTSCASGPGKDATIWDLDNEPEYWSAVHRDVHPNPMTYDEITNGGIGTSLAIKAVDPNALVSGPVISGWYDYFYSQQDVNAGYSAGPCYQPWGNPTDRQNHSGVPLIEYYIQQMSSASDTYNVRLLDFVDIHAYYAAMYNGASVAFTTAGDTGEQQARMNSTRAFWDSTYTDPNNTGLYQPVYPPTYPSGTTQNSPVCKTPASPNLIPMLQKWAADDWTSTKFPQRLKTSIDEYNFGATESINGAVVQADVLGIFGKYGLDMATFWPTSTYTTQVPANMAFAIYRNYDGNKSMFGDQELSSTTGDQSQLAVYAASRTSDGAVTIVVINKTYGPLTNTLSINNLTSTATAAQVFQYSNANLTAIVAQPNATITPPASGTISTISATFPGQSITLIVIP
jgi:Glycoside hydrolase family 44